MKKLLVIKSSLFNGEGQSRQRAAKASAIWLD